MIHKAWCCLDEVPYCFSRSSVKFQGHRAKKIVDFEPNWAFPDCNSSLNLPTAMKWYTKLEAAWESALLSFKVICQMSRSHGTKNCWFWPKLSVSGLQLQLEFTHGFQMMHKAYCSIEEVSYCFSRSFVKFQCHAGQKFNNFDPNWAFPDCNSSLDSLMDLKWCTELDVV